MSGYQKYKHGLMVKAVTQAIPDEVTIEINCFSEDKDGLLTLEYTWGDEEYRLTEDFSVTAEESKNANCAVLMEALIKGYLETLDSIKRIQDRLKLKK